MYLLDMRPEEIEESVRENVPVIMATGVMEYHGPHLPIGTDMIIARGLVRDIEKECRCIAAPELPYGTTMNWAGSPTQGQIDFNGDIGFLHIREVFKGLLKIGFRRIYVMQHHQGMGEQHLGAMLAARQCIGDLARTWQDGWGKLPAEKLPEPDIFGCIQVLGITAKSTCPWEIEVGHGSKGETQLMLHYAPETVKPEELSRMKEKPPWLEDSHLADVEKARKDIEFCVSAWREELSKE